MDGGCGCVATRIGSDVFGAGSVWFSGVSFGATVSMIALRLFKAALVNEPMALPTMLDPIEFSSGAGITRTPASRKVGRASTDAPFSPGTADIP